jgi:fumarylacetoacetate (FAA) hydrolase
MRIGRALVNEIEVTVVSYEGHFYDISNILDETRSTVYDLKETTVYEFLKSAHPIDGEVTLSVPLKSVNQIRDFYAFEEHAMNSRKTRGLDMIKEWYEIPIYYYTNKDALIPGDSKIKKPSFTEQLDLEVEIGIVIGKDGKNIKRENALDYIYGLTLMNDWSARDLWKSESKLNLGPSKSKDFATSIGPYITTISELLPLWNGKSFDIEVESYINGIRFSKSNMKDIYFSVGQMLEYCSMDSQVKMGDIIMTGTFPGGCIFEKAKAETKWLNKGDNIEIKSNVLGSLKNEVI